MPNFGIQILDENMEDVDCFLEDFENRRQLIDWWAKESKNPENKNWHFCIFWKALFTFLSAEY